MKIATKASIIWWKMHFIETLTAKWLEVNRGLNAYCVEVSVKSHCMLEENAIGTFSRLFAVLPTSSLTDLLRMSSVKACW